MSHDFDTPEGRLAALLDLGPERYGEALRAKMERDVVAVANGYSIRLVSSRFGRIFIIDGTGAGYATQCGAEVAAAKLPRGPRHG